MSQRYTQDGVELVVAGLREFMSDLSQAGVAWDDTIQRFRATSGEIAKTTEVGPAFAEMQKRLAGTIPVLDQLGSQLGTATAAAGGLSAGTVGLGLALGGLVLAGKAVIAVFRKVVEGMKAALRATMSLGMRSLQLAGEFQEMELTALAIGRTMGMTREEIEGAAQDMVDLGIRVDAANKIVAQFARYQLDMASAVDLVRVAQATGILMHRDSTEEMEALVHAALGGNTIMLRQRQIFVNNERAYEKFADSMDRNVETLTEAEKAQARLNAIIEEGAKVLDVYGAAMQSPTKQLRSLTGRELPQLQAQLGAPFLMAWSQVIGAVRDVVKALVEATREGGNLYPVLVKLGAAASLVADGFEWAAQWIVKWIQQLDGSVVSGISGIIEKMFTFGFELVATFAEGIVHAASTVLIGAMKAIGWVIENWIMPSSPPKIAPGLTQWAIDAMNLYLKGFSMADFSLLEAVQDPLSRILQGPDFAGFSQELIAAISAGEQLTPDFYDRIAAAAGKFGESVAELARRKVVLAIATNEATAAEERLKKAQEDLTDAQAAVTEERREYNELLREGADAATLSAQMRQVRNAEAQARAARAEVAASEDAKDAAKERQEQAQERYDLQSKLVDQLLRLEQAQRDIDKEAAKKEKAKKGEPVIPEPEMPEGLGWSLATRMSEAIEKAKAALKEKLKELTQPLRDAWEEMKLDLLILEVRWDIFTNSLIADWQRLKQEYPILYELDDWLKNQPDDVTFLQGVWEFFKERLGEWWGELEEKYPILDDITDAVDSMGETVDIVKGKWKSFKEKLVEWWEDLREAWDEGRIWEFFVGQSPSPLEKGLHGIRMELNRLDMSMFASASRLLPLAYQSRQPRYATQAITHSTAQTVQITIGDVAITDRAEGDRFQDRVEQAVLSALRKG